MRTHRRRQLGASIQATGRPERAGAWPDAIQIEVSKQEVRMICGGNIAKVLVPAAFLLGGEAQAADFPSVVRKILDSQTTGRLASMGMDQRVRMTDCVVSTLSGLPGGKKRFIVEGANLDEQEHRFGEALNEERAKWKQNIARACSSIAMGNGSDD
jgi:hypothetical protein